MIIADLSLVMCGLYVNIKTYWKLYIDRKSHTESLRLKQDIPISNIKDDRFNRKFLYHHFVKLFAPLISKSPVIRLQLQLHGGAAKHLSLIF